MKVLFAVLIALAALILIALVRAVRAAAPPAKPRLPADPEGRADSYAKALSKMVRVPTVTGDRPRFDELHDVMRELFPALWAAAEIDSLEDGSLLLRWPSERPELPPIVLMGHQDVVPASPEGWTYPPFSGEVRDGRVWGRGSFDCKATLFCELQALEELINAGERPPRDVYIASSSNEETGGEGALSLAKLLESRGVKPAIVLDEGSVIMTGAIPGMDRPFAPIGIIEKGQANVRITARSAGGHSSEPPKNSPLARLAAFVNEMERKRPFKRRLTPVVERTLAEIAPTLPLGYRFLFCNLWLFRPLLNVLLPSVDGMFDAWMGTTFCFTMCSGSDAPNVIPQEAHVVCNLRLGPEQGAEQALTVIKKYAASHGLEAEMLSGKDASQLADTENEDFEKLCASLRSRCPDIGVGTYMLFGGTDCRRFEALTRHTYRMTPLRINAQQFSAVHGVDENIDAAALAETTGFYKELVREYAR